MQKKLNKLFELQEELKEKQGAVSEALRITKTPENLKTLHKVTRNDKEVEVSEKTLWTEVWTLGENCEAGKILKGKYPDAFSKGKTMEEAQVQMSELVSDMFGVEGKLTTPDLVKIILTLIDFKAGKTESVEPTPSA